jgi:hypothetical protein
MCDPDISYKTIHSEPTKSYKVIAKVISVEKGTIKHICRTMITDDRCGEEVRVDGIDDV